ncbi:hypothetical protein [Sphingorhabdus sp. EL138]|nr:hypothetical protein [Sphingorhabdus sp. EL138]
MAGQTVIHIDLDQRNKLFAKSFLLKQRSRKDAASFIDLPDLA